MKLTIHRGTREIGGSCVELTTATTRLVLDLGLPLVDAHREPFDSRAALAKSPEVLKVEKVIPPILGLFDTDHPAPDAVLLSHAHLDHAGLLHFSRATRPDLRDQWDQQNDAGGSRVRRSEAIGSRTLP